MSFLDRDVRPSSLSSQPKDCTNPAENVSTPIHPYPLALFYWNALPFRVQAE
jgi:hypothetical protein